MKTKEEILRNNNYIDENGFIDIIAIHKSMEEYATQKTILTMDNIKTYNEAKIAFKNSEGREPNMNNIEDMRIISAIQLGIEHILKILYKD